MPKYSYVVKDKEGRSFKNITDAVNKKIVIDKLQKQGYYIISVRQITVGKSADSIRISKKKQFTHKKATLGDLLGFARQFATMLESGITITRALSVIQTQVESEELHKVMTKVKNDVEQGRSLSQALSAHPKVFNQFWISLSEVGEASGTIPMVFNKLTFYLEQQEKFKSVVISGIIYPSILFIVATGAVAFFALFVGPRFQDIFKSMNVPLPGITIFLLGLFNFIKTYSLHIIGAGFVAFIFLKLYIKTYYGRINYEKFLFNLPIFGDIIKLIVIERFCSQMAILIDSGVPILYALDIAERLVSNNTCALIVSEIKEGVKRGEVLVAPMERSGFFTPMTIQMIQVGEETGELSKMFKHISEFYQAHVSTFMQRFSTIVEPIMLVFMGGVIGTIVIAMFLPMFNIAQLGGAGG
ncbi:MAG: type II secretion system F family protein [Candidatus Omnitrophica bacterium]|nr:type II secretion system F family protein [Candidatus Omnitrophota bacterium]